MAQFPQPPLTMKSFVYLLLVVVASCCPLTSGQTRERLVTKTLTLNNGLDWGKFGALEYCKEGSWAAYVQAKFEPYGILDTDETALNALKLYCVTRQDILKGYIMSTEGTKGKWQDIKECHFGFLTGMRARVLPPQGVLGDDVAVQNFQLECDYGKEIVSAVDGAYARIPLGEWGDWSACPKDSAICGMQTRYNSATAAVDDAGVTDMLMFCCSLNETITTTTTATTAV